MAMSTTREWRLQWAKDFLQGLKLEPTQNRMKFLMAWMAGENTSSTYNPLATTQDMRSVDPGQSNYNYNGGYPVKNYTNYNTGLKANLITIQNGYFNEILRYLKQDLDIVNYTPLLVKQLQLWGTGYLVIANARMDKIIYNVKVIVQKYWLPATLIGVGAGCILYISWKKKLHLLLK
jgi:hypothetical protein